jgi:hypothetical protein
MMALLGTVLLLVLIMLGLIVIWLFFSGGPPHGHWKE